MIGSTSTGDRGTFPIMSLNPLAPAFLPYYQSPSDPPISLCNSIIMSLPLAQFFCGMPPLITSSHAFSLAQPITVDFFILTLIQPKNPLQQDAAAHQASPGFSSLLSSPLQNQANCLQVIHKPSNSSTNSCASTGRHYNILSFNCRMTLHYCASSFSLRLQPFPSVILPLGTLLPVQQFTLNLTVTLFLLQMHSCFPAQLNFLFVVQPLWALWDHSEQKRTILQTPISSPNATPRKLLQLRRRTSHQESLNSNKFLQMK